MGKPAVGAGAGAALRKEAEAALRLEREGRHDEALARVDELAGKNTGSALVLHLAGLVHHAAAKRAIAASQKKEAAHHLMTAHDYLAEAKRLVPNCIDISVRLARVLFEALKHDEAENEVRRAISTPFAVDPAENNVMYSVDARVSTTREQRVESCRESARICFRFFGNWICNQHVPRVVSEVLELETDERVGAAKALKTADDLAKRYPYSCRAQLIRAYMKLKFARGLDAAIDKRPFLDRILADMNEAAIRFDGSLVLAMFRAKLCFVLGLYDALYVEFGRAVAIQKPVDPKLEDVPPGSVNGEECDDRVSFIFQEIARMLRRLLWVAKGYWCSMTSEKQGAYLSVGLVELQKYYDKIYENDHWAARTISDALSFVKKNRSWRFWICPFCVGKKLPDTDSLLRHMYNKHSAEKVLLKLRSVFDPKPSDDAPEDDYSLDEITVCQDSEGHYFFQLKNTDYIFEHLFLEASNGIKAKSFAEIREEHCKEGTEILRKVKQKLKNLPAENSTEFDKARPEIQDLWHDFLAISALDYRVVIWSLAKTFLWAKLINSMSKDNAASKHIDNADIDAIFPNIVDPPDSNAIVEHGSKLSNGNKDHKIGDDQKIEKMKPSHSDETLKADEKFEERLASEAGATAKVLSEVAKTTFTGATCVDPVTTPSARNVNKRNDDSLRWKKPDIQFVYARRKLKIKNIQVSPRDRRLDKKHFVEERTLSAGATYVDPVTTPSARNVNKRNDDSLRWKKPDVQFVYARRKLKIKNIQVSPRDRTPDKKHFVEERTLSAGATCVDPVTTPSARNVNKRNDDSLRWKKPDVQFVYARRKLKIKNIQVSPRDRRPDKKHFVEERTLSAADDLIENQNVAPALLYTRRSKPKTKAPKGLEKQSSEVEILHKFEEKVCIIYDKRMLRHAPPAGVSHREIPRRISAIYKRIEKDGWLNRCDVYEACRAEVQDLLAAHSQEHVEYVLRLPIQFDEEKAKLWKKKRTLKQEIKKKEVEMPPDPDMYNSSGTADAALFAAGGVIKACDLVARGIHRNAFAIVRPPGHHANRDKAMGFCYLNNIAVGAHYLLNKHQFKRILLVDWDVHHGNGTQDIFYGNSNVLFFSLHRFAEDFYPRFTNRVESDIGTGVGKGYNANICWRKPKIKDDDFFAVWVHVLMPLARQFSPDIILISAGFDAAAGDYIGDCSVTPRGFGTLLSELNEYCIESNIGLIMALEGGYNISAIEKSALACVKVLCGDKGDIKDINQHKPLESTWDTICKLRRQLRPFWSVFDSKIPEQFLSQKRVPPNG